MQIDSSWYTRNTEVPDRTSAGGVIVLLEEGEILVAVAHEAEGAWALPKGGVEEGESLLDAATREIAEETGLTDLTSLGLLGTSQRYGLGKGIWITQHFFLFVTQQRAGVPTDPRHTKSVTWYPLSHFPDLFWPEQTAMVRENAGEIVLRLHTWSKTGQQTSLNPEQ